MLYSFRHFGQFNGSLGSLEGTGRRFIPLELWSVKSADSNLTCRTDVALFTGFSPWLPSSCPISTRNRSCPPLPEQKTHFDLFIYRPPSIAQRIIPAEKKKSMASIPSFLILVKTPIWQLTCGAGTLFRGIICKCRHFVSGPFLCVNVILICGAHLRLANRRHLHKYPYPGGIQRQIKHIFNKSRASRKKTLEIASVKASLKVDHDRHVHTRQNRPWRKAANLNGRLRYPFYGWPATWNVGGA